jgi:hypothetical protein
MRCYLITFVFLMFGSLSICYGSEESSQVVELVVAEPVSMPVRHAISTLTEALRNFKADAEIHSDLSDTQNLKFVIGIPGENPVLDSLLTEHQRSVPEQPESLLIAKISLQSQNLVLIAGRDDRGTAYAILEVAAALRTAPQGADIWNRIKECRESPHVAVRSVTKQLFNEDLERIWYESEEYWHWYFGMLAESRFNHFSLTLGHNSNYLIPPSAWMLEVPEYPEVTIAGASPEDRERRLHHFRRITEIAKEHGIRFTLGLWTQLPVVKVREGLDFGDSPVTGLPEGEKRADYCRVGLKRLLESCPAIDGVQLRMNLESGVPENQQEEFYRSVFAGIAECGRPVSLDLRYKSLNQKTIDLARQAGLDVTVSTKFWCEHQGLPYHPTWQDAAYSASRYGFGSMLKHGRNYRVLFRLWNVGSSRLLLWADPDYAARFAESCTQVGGEGYEVFAPMSYRGYGNEPGEWHVRTDPSLEPYRWEQQRYWPFYLAFGRFGYHPETSQEVWNREFTYRFDDQGESLQSALRSASQVLPLLTATTLFSANSWRFWPEMLPCMSLDAYRAIQPSDYSQFYAIAPYPSRQQWRAEDWISGHSAFVEDAIQGNLNAKWTPYQVSHRLEALADAIQASCLEIKRRGEIDPEVRSLLVDLHVLAQLARYHAEKKKSAIHLEFFRLTKDPLRLRLAWKHIQLAHGHWQEIVRETDGYYADHLVFGHSKEHYCDFPNKLHLHSGHWKDRLSETEADVNFVRELLQKNGLPLADLTEEEMASLRRYPGEEIPAARIQFQHERIRSAIAGKDLPVQVRVNSDTPLKLVSVYFRPLNQTVPWKRISLVKSENDDTYRGVIPAGEINPQFDFQYYFEARHDSGGRFWPDWQNETPYVVVSVISN